MKSKVELEEVLQLLEGAMEAHPLGTVEHALLTGAYQGIAFAMDEPAGTDPEISSLAHFINMMKTLAKAKDRHGSND